MFLRPGGGARSWMRIRKGKYPGVPLFGGEYSFHFEEILLPSSPQSIDAKLRLTLNPTRFLRHQNPEKYVPARRMFPAPAATFFRRELVPVETEYALDNEDNWIPDSSEFYSLSHPNFWP